MQWIQMDLLARTAHALSEGAHGPTEPERQSRTRPTSSELAGSSDAKFKVLICNALFREWFGAQQDFKSIVKQSSAGGERINDR